MLGQWNGTISISYIFTQNWITHLCVPPHACMPVSMQGANSSGRDGRLVYLTRHLLNELNFPRYGFFFVVCIKLSNYVESTGQATQWFGDIIFHISRRMFTTWFTLSEPSLWNILCLVADWARQSVSLGSRFWTQLHCDTQRELPEAPLHLLCLLSLKHKRKWSLWELFRPEPAAYWAA